MYGSTFGAIISLIILMYKAALYAIKPLIPDNTVFFCELEERLMSGKPTGVLILAILQLIAAILYLIAGGMLLMVALGLGIFAILAAFPALILFIVGIIGLILFYGLYTTKKWAWLWTLIINLLGILGGLLRVGELLTDYAGLAGFAVSLIIVIYLLMPGTRAHFK